MGKNAMLMYVLFFGEEMECPALVLETIMNKDVDELVDPGKRTKCRERNNG